MNFEPLYELKNRLENVAVVGINLAKDDFRLKRAVEQLKNIVLLPRYLNKYMIWEMN